ncbi:mannitol dehydrogenase family protein [Nakamurella endophytica]|uniref:mannitol dehydrogenase family protein n=1 Tax=Nakamurella endophytica TaxID=1748367 RepID=UPI001E3D6DF4|nr:mannitol dehydrogenase family protein [Nakamurella endophytica]
MLSRARGDGRPAAPVRIVHLGLGNFFRAHEAWYTDRAPDADRWGIAAFTGRSTAPARVLAAQDCLYTVLTRAADGDTARVVGSLSRAHSGTDHAAWLASLADPAVAILSLTVTEAAYLRSPDGGLAADLPEVRHDVATLRQDLRAPVQTVPGRLMAGLAARRSAAGPGSPGVRAGLAVLPGDNLPGNGGVAARVVTELASRVDPGLAGWIEQHVSFVGTVVDRITPATTDADLEPAAALTGRTDRAPVVTEPYTEWQLCGDFPAGHPDWAAAGARWVDDIAPFEDRKLWLLNGGHSLLAYAGGALGHGTVAEAVSDARCRRWLGQWWDEAVRHLALPDGDKDRYRAALVERWRNPRIRHRLAQIAADGSQKLPVRVLPAVRAERRAGRLPAGGLRVLAGWIVHLRGRGPEVTDVAADRFRALAAGPPERAVPAVLDALDPALARDRPVVDTTARLCRDLEDAAR